MTVHEPMTLATDLALGLLTFLYAAWLFRDSAGGGRPATRLWGWAFVCSATAAILGGLHHGFAPSMTEGGSAMLWRATLVAGGGAGFFLVLSAAWAALRDPARRIVLVGALMKLAAYTVWTAARPDFRWLVYDYGSAMLAVAILHAARLHAAQPAPGSWWVIAGIAASIAAALVQQSGYTLHRHFNHNDLFHVLQMGATTLLYRGGMAMRA